MTYMENSTCLLKKTPFNGYNRDQVIEYITQMDKSMRNMQETYERQIADITDALSQANACIESLHQSANVLSQNLKDKQIEADAAKEEMDKAIIELSKQKSIASELNEKLQQSEKLLNDNIQIIQQSKKLREELAQAKELISQKDEEIAQLKEDIQLCVDIKNNIDQILTEVKLEAKQIKDDAQKQADEILSAAKNIKARTNRDVSLKKTDIMNKVMRLKRDLKGN